MAGLRVGDREARISLLEVRVSGVSGFGRAELVLGTAESVVVVDLTPVEVENLGKAFDAARECLQLAALEGRIPYDPEEDKVSASYVVLSPDLQCVPKSVKLAYLMQRLEARGYKWNEPTRWSQLSALLYLWNHPDFRYTDYVARSPVKFFSAMLADDLAQIGETDLKGSGHFSFNIPKAMFDGITLPPEELLALSSQELIKKAYGEYITMVRRELASRGKK